MHSLEIGILEVFRRDPSRSFSTSELVRELFKEEHALFQQQINSSDKRTARKGHNLKATLHRKLLYHLNKLIEQQLLVVAGIRGKGEKLFSLSMEEGELLVQGSNRKIIISKPSSITTPIDGYEAEGLVRKYRPSTWLNKHNAIMLDGLAFSSFDELQQRLQQVFPAVNDAIALGRFEHLLTPDSLERAERFLDYLFLDAHDYDIAVAILVHVATLEQEEQLLQLLRCFVPRLPRQVTFSFSLTPRLLMRKSAFFLQLFQIFSEGKQKLTLKNSAIFPTPIFFGRAGPYSFAAEDWEYFKERIRGKADGCVVGQIGLVVDINRYFQEGGTLSGLRELAERVSHAFFEVEEQRRKHFGEYFGHLSMPSLDSAKEFFRVGRSYLRFWNYDWAEAEENILDLLESVRETLDQFSSKQETIFKSCGLPIRFRIGMSTSFAKFDPHFFSERRYQKTAITGVKELQSKPMRRYLQIRERLFQIFEGADRLRFFIGRGVPEEEMLRIARYLLSSYDLPCFTFDYRGKSGELKLTTFMEGG